MRAVTTVDGMTATSVTDSRVDTANSIQPPTFAIDNDERKDAARYDMALMLTSDIATAEPVGATATANTQTSPPSFFSWSNFVVVIPNLVIPLLYGYHLGVAGVYITLYEYATNCELYKAQKPCETLSGAKCKWMAATSTQAGVCGWADTKTCSSIYTSEEPCKADPVCAWNVKDERCGNQVGYTSTFQGLLACGMIIGAMAGSFAGGVLTKKLNFRMTFFVIGAVACVSQVLTHVSTAFYNYWLLFVARIILGVAMGWQAIAAPSYTSKFADKAHEKTLGTLFQVSTAFGAFVSSIFAVALGDTIGYSADRDANLKGRLHGFIAFPTLLSGLVMLLPLVTKDEVTHRSEVYDGDVAGSHEHTSKQHEDEDYTYREMMLPLFIGVVMAASVQLTGMLSVVTYAPIIMRNLNLDAFVGNLVVMAWSALVVMTVIPLSQRFSMRWLFMASTFLGSVFCLLLCGVPVYPGVSKSDKAKSGVAIAGILLFILVYLAGAGPCFYVLAIDVFPRSFRHIGSAVTVCTNFVFNLLITLCYPIATEGISGGPSGNPDKGQAVAFIFFGCIGFITVAIEYFFMHPWEERHVRAANDVAGTEPL